MSIALQSIKELVQRSVLLEENLKANFNAPNNQRVLDKRWPMSEVQGFVGRTDEGIRNAEDRGALPKPDMNERNNRRKGYTLPQINYMREQFGTHPRRSPTEDDVSIIAVQNFKGGVGKSTCATHLSHYLARQGYRVLLVDCDSQATATRFFGYNPDQDLKESDTLLSYLAGDTQHLRNAVRDTHWEGLKLIPANLHLYAAEYMIAGRAQANSSDQIYSLLRNGLDTVKNDFDVVIIDAPPALGMISLNVLYASNSVIVPMLPSMPDFYSTIQFFTMLEEVLEHFPEDMTYDFVKVLITRKESRTEGTSSQDDISEDAAAFYGDYMMRSIFYKSRAIENASSEARTIFEVNSPKDIGVDSKTFRRGIETVEDVCGEIEGYIRNTWPSEQRRNAGRVANA
ncbi:hypothetical protein BOW53_16100 [Solemya pervernicosa gill symbiont]|uniref:AAA domain-containing protein n=1 Tax=Solemya pervernicosa gill symbiont TaxID=642797 RepID=A0A1T2KZJ3_9GAMM|nr:AAA family ATPase [Solemya pervernicosa gill symbiont]OOZ38265.1 hypothetical protein BOW53_16100 [Solemya pervernicosa gill symbiont]